MTVWKLPPAAPASASTSTSADADLLDLMASLDALPTQRSAPKTKATSIKPAVPTPPVFVQQWFPHALVEHYHEQSCRCGHDYTSITGLFLEDQHRNGALRQTRHSSGKIPYAYFNLPRRAEFTTETLSACPECSAYEFESPPDATLPSDLVRALTQDDLNSLGDPT
jgi:hypothetical protein